MARRRVGQRHTNKVYFRDSELDFYLQAFPLGYATYGGATAGEALFAASQVQEKDPETWVAAWSDLSARVADGARRSLDAGHRTDARNAYLRAFTYGRTATLLMRVSDPRFAATVQLFREHFRHAAALFDPPLEQLRIPFEGAALPAWFARPPQAGPDGDHRRPTLIVIGGGETFCEDLWFWGAAAALERGYNALIVDLPGQGATPFDGQHHRYDSEAPLGAVLDHLGTRSDVDPDRTTAYGVSLGGYLVLRAAAHDRRLKACAVSTPIRDVHQLFRDAMPGVLRHAPDVLFRTVMKAGRFFSPAQHVAFEKFFQWQVGARGIPQAMDGFRRWTVDVEDITCPVLCMVGTGEGETFKKQTTLCYDALRAPKALRVFTREEGADAHCQAVNLRLAHEEVFAFFDESLRERSAAAPPELRVTA